MSFPALLLGHSHSGHRLLARPTSISPSGMSVVVEFSHDLRPSPPTKIGLLHNYVPRASPNEGRAGSTQSAALAQVYLLTTALLWGTYSPCVRLIYAQPGAPTPEALTAVRSLIQASFLVLTSSVIPLIKGSPPSRRCPASSRSKLDQALRRSGLLTGSSSSSKRKGTTHTLQGAVGTASDASFVTGALLAAGLELGLWNFCATASQALALEATTATRGAFLLQATTMITPVLSTVAGARPHRQVWLGCCIALAGTLLINLDHASPSASTALSSKYLLGDAGMLSAAFFYSLATVRLGSLASNLAPLRLAASKSCALALFAVIWLCAYALSHGAGDEGSLQQLWPSSGNQLQWALLLYSAVGPGATAAWLQVQGQSKVAPAQAQVLFSTVPLWAALMSWVTLPGDESLGPGGWVGGLAITVASLVASRAPKPADSA